MKNELRLRKLHDKKLHRATQRKTQRFAEKFFEIFLRTQSFCKKTLSVNFLFERNSVQLCVFLCATLCKKKCHVLN